MLIALDYSGWQCARALRAKEELGMRSRNFSVGLMAAAIAALGLGAAILASAQTEKIVYNFSAYRQRLRQLRRHCSGFCW
jgi:hypothetical protein